MVFTGEYEHTIDAKNRLAIPADVRALVGGKTGGGRSKSVNFFATLGEVQSLYLYTEAGFEQRAAELIQSDAEADQLLTYERMYFSLARRVEMDSAGRIRLPENLIKRAQLGNDVVLLGVNDHLEIRDRETWHNYVEQMLREQPQLWMNPRRAIRKSRSEGAG